ncbi:IS66 family insertion sequence element accessory protein TnpB [Limosilactobacillus fermentum]
MLVNWQDPKHVYIVCGKTDLRKGIDGLAIVVQENYGLGLFDDSLFLFCGNRNDRFKGLYWDGEGFILLYKRFENGGLRWPRYRNDAHQLTKQQIRQLLEGINPLPPRRVKPASHWPFY